MPVRDPDWMSFLLSAPSAAAGNVATAVPGNSLGRFASRSWVSSGSLDNLFPDISGPENLASNVDHQCLFLLNAHPRNTLLNTTLWVSADISGGATWSLAVDDIPPTPIGSAMQQADVVMTKNSAPSAVGNFSAPTTKSAGLALGTIGPGQVKAFWVRREAHNAPQILLDGGTLRVEADTYFAYIDVDPDTQYGYGGGYYGDGEYPGAELYGTTPYGDGVYPPEGFYGRSYYGRGQYRR